MKKIIAILLAAMMVLGMVTCGTAEPATTTGAPAPVDTTPAGGDDTTPADTTPADTTPADTTPADTTVNPDDIADEMTSKDGKKHKFTAGETITITIVPVSDAKDYAIEFRYKVVEKKTLGVIKGIKIERITE